MRHDELDAETQDRLDAAAFRRLLAHLDARKDVQNIDLMILADFCRNCLGKWYHAASDEAGVDISDDEARERVYGMSYAQWKSEHQTPASDEQMAAFKARRTSS